MNQYPHTAKVVDLFIAHVLEEPSDTNLGLQFCVSLPTITLGTLEPGELPISPKFSSKELLEEFCRKHWFSYVLLEDAIRESGTVPPMFWES
jgi:hypothetical protein